MNIYIVGAGAVGTYFGDLLHGIGNEVTFAPRNLEDVVPVEADLAIVAVKAYDTPAAVRTLERALGAGATTTIVTPQNGVGNEELLAAAFGAQNVVACALTVPIGTDRNGKSTASNTGGVAFAPVERGAVHNWLIAAFNAAGLTATAAEDYRTLKWSKLALNVVANASCAILNVLPERLVHTGDVFSLEIRSIREVRAVMQAMGIHSIDLPRYPVRALQAVAALPSLVARGLLRSRIAGARGSKPPSLLLDLRAMKNRTEVNVLNGAVAQAAREHGIAAPVNTVFARVVSDIANMPQLWAKYRENPETLAAEVDAEIARSRGGS